MPREKLPDSALAALDFWKRLRGNRTLPKRSDFKPFEWRAWISDMSIVELHKGENRHFVSLHGSRTQDVIGINLHKRYMEEHLDVAARPLALDPYHESERTGLPTYSIMAPMLYPSVFDAIPRLVLPFTDDTPDGGPDRIDRFITWIGVDAESCYGIDELCAGQQRLLEKCDEIREKIGLVVLDSEKGIA